MSNFRNIKAKVYITNKIIKKIQGGGAFCTNRIAQKCLSVALILALAVGMMSERQAQAVEPTVFTTSAHANHWGRSTFRAYLNNATRTDKTLPFDTTIDGTNSANFPSKFSDAEFALVEPFTCMTSIYRPKSVFETTDRFWLLSGDSYVISWGCEDITEVAQYSKSTVVDKARLIPTSYWAYGVKGDSWCRSPGGNASRESLTRRGSVVTSYEVHGAITACAAAFKINLGSVIFASAASAKDIVGNSASDAKKIEIAGSENFGKRTEAALPDYGMYLKTASGKSFTANSLNLSGTNLTVNYTGGEAGQYVVVQAFNEDSLTAGTTGYVAAKQLEAGQTSATIDATNWGINSLNGYTVKVWMEDNTGSLAKATIPETFVCINGVFVKTTDGAVQNGRVFAQKKDLQSSCGNMAELDDTAYNNILAGNGQDGTDGAATNSMHGVNPTNQKIYFGIHNGAPLEFWICGRETAANGGTIDSNGDIMTLYQAKAVEIREFNSWPEYTVEGKPAVTLQLAEDQMAIYTKSPAAYPTGQITTADLVDGYSLNWLYRTPGTNTWTEGMPTALGTYEVRCYTPGTENYERTYSNVVNFIIKEEPKPWHFVFTGPSNLVYDGTPKTVTIEQKPGITGMGAITTKYYMVNKDGTETLLSGAPINAIKCRVKFYVAEGTKFTAATDLSPVFVPKN